MKHKLMTNSDCIKWLKTFTEKQLIAYTMMLEIPLLRPSLHTCRWHIIEYNSNIVFQAPELKHFVRVGENGEILEDPNPNGGNSTNWHLWTEEYKKRFEAWEKAGEKIVIPGCYNYQTEINDLVYLMLPNEQPLGNYLNVPGEIFEFFEEFKTMEDVIRVHRE